jgi:hypothetical protein
MLLSKFKKHFVGITWVDGDIKGRFAMQCDKINQKLYRSEAPAKRPAQISSERAPSGSGAE